MLPFSVQIRSGEPVSRQVIQAVHRALVTGQLKVGEVFPSVRVLSKELKINPNTAFKIVAHLKQEGLLEVQPGKGTFVSGTYTPQEVEKANLLEEKIEALVIEARKLNLKKSEVQEAIDKIWKQL